jgi:uncharacterized membrane protein YbhN (UPF0104 family)
MWGSRPQLAASFGIYGLATDLRHAMTATQRLGRTPAHHEQRRDDRSLKPHSLRVRMITLTLFAIGALTVLLAVPELREVLAAIRHLKAPWLILAIALELASCLSFVIIFRHFFDGLPARLARAVAWTEMGSGALLSGGGAGSLAIGGWLVHRAGMPTREIVRRSSGLFFLTSATNVAALIGGGLLLLTGISSSSHPLLLGGPPILAGLLGAGGAIALPPLMRHHPAWTKRWFWLQELTAGIGEAEHALLRPSWRQLGALGYLGFDIAVLWATFGAVGYHPQLATLLLGYIIGYLANMIPIPGGIGVLEGGLVGRWSSTALRRPRPSLASSSITRSPSGSRASAASGPTPGSDASSGATHDQHSRAVWRGFACRGSASGGVCARPGFIVGRLFSRLFSRLCVYSGARGWLSLGSSAASGAGRSRLVSRAQRAAITTLTAAATDQAARPPLTVKTTRTAPAAMSFS